jgi:hypothetical protein
MIIGYVLGEQTPQMLLVEDDDMIKQLASYAANHSLHVWVLPRAPRRNEHFFDTHVPHTLSKVRAIDTISIAQEIVRCPVPRKGFHHLLDRLLRGGVLRDVKVHNAAPLMRENYQHEEHLERHGRNGQEVQGDHVLPVILEERSPRR